MSFNVPIIRLQIDHLRQTIQTALMDQQIRVDADIQAAVEAFCKPENIQEIVMKQTSVVLRTMIEEEIHTFFRSGKGRAIISSFVVKILTQTTNE